METPDPVAQPLADKSYQKQYRALHKEELKAKVYAWRKTPSGKASVRASQQKARDKINAGRRERRRLSPEKALARDKRYREKYREARNAKRRAAHDENPLPRREEAKLYATRHPDRVRARFRRWYQKSGGHNVQRQRHYRQTHPEKPRLHNEARRARKLGLPNTFTSIEHHFMRQYWHHACAVCGNEEGLWWLLADDHWIPLSTDNSPGTVAENIVPLCHGQGGCNNAKRDSDPIAWLASRYTSSQAKRILKAVETYFALVRARKAQGVAG